MGNPTGTIPRRRIQYPKPTYGWMVTVLWPSLSNL